jgi:hypothetical protein
MHIRMLELELRRPPKDAYSFPTLGPAPRGDSTLLDLFMLNITESRKKSKTKIFGITNTCVSLGAPWSYINPLQWAGKQ